MYTVCARHRAARATQNTTDHGEFRKDGAGAYPPRCMTDPLATWHDFNVSVVTASAALLGLLFVALSIHIRTLMATRNAELRAVARTVFLGYVIALGIGFLALVPQGLGSFGYEVLALVVFAAIPFT